MALISTFLFVAACEEIATLQQEKSVQKLSLPIPESSPEAAPAPTTAEDERTAIETETEEKEQACVRTEDCSEKLECIDGSCQTLASLYEIDYENNCPATCTLQSVQLRTSDGEDYSLRRGQGSYTAAGALAWEVMGTPVYCSGETPLVPIKFIKKTTGTVIEAEIVTLHKGETTRIITHPLIPRVQFTITVKDVEEECTG
ncbi:MAG: hypothetical protein Q8R53_03540 [Nanoarchaeota archaeon]|nr:hypothetical protein [Nanoarchaeota archaeon]